ncbi:hypothetical protein F2Q68_00026623 [Brassica cretica]|uniref:Uncharacterized protein n=1 Tax=Brassica cretica TaxID=69181 RepID=A0A8S9IHR9_BRACR|nr:hypothetical protein F2Q68_00026623 [Brassica cretica]
MNSLQLHCCLPPQHRRCSAIFTPRTYHFLGKISFRESLITKAKANSFSCCAQSETTKQSSLETSLSENQEPERPPFDINLAVILAGFAFESYATPPENIGKREVNAAGCKTLFLSEYVTLFIDVFVAKELY